MSRLLHPSAVAEEQDPEGFVYAMKCTSFVKIGWSTQVDRRLNQIRSCNPREVHLLGTVRGTVGDEYMLHLVLRQEHYRGEWFRHQGFTEMAIQKFKEFETAKEVIQWLQDERERLLDKSKDVQSKIASGEYTV